SAARTLTVRLGGNSAGSCRTGLSRVVIRALITAPALVAAPLPPSSCRRLYLTVMCGPSQTRTRSDNGETVPQLSRRGFLTAATLLTGACASPTRPAQPPRTPTTTPPE